MRTRNLLFVAFTLGVARLAFGAVTINIPAGSGIATSQRPDPSLIEHFPLENFITWEVFIRNPTMALTFTGGTGQFYDENGNPILGVMNITPAMMAQMGIEFAPMSFPNCGDGAVDVGEACDDGNTNTNDGCTNFCTLPIMINGDGEAVIPINSNIGFPFPFEKIPHNVVPGSVDMVLCFEEFEGPNGECSDPLSFLGVALIEYTTPPGDTYIYPLPEPNPMIGGVILSGGGHEIGKGHRFAFNQRYAYDVGVQDGNASCDPCDTNAGFFVYGEPVLAMADGVVTVNEEGHPENASPGVVDPNVGGCPAQNCDGSTPACGNPGGFPGGGNMVVLGHNNGEFSFYAHMITGSNDDTDCNETKSQGQMIGSVGNSGSSSGPHIHFHNLPNQNPDDPGSQSVPVYFTNIQFGSPGFIAKRQLEAAVPSGTLLSILPPPAPLPQNAPSPAGNVAEVEPNNTLAQHQALTFPAMVMGTAEAADVGEIAVRGDGIEDIYRVDFANSIALRINLFGFSASENLDVYVLTEDLRVLNPTRVGTTPADGVAEEVCLTLQPGAYYIFVTNVDAPNRSDTDYLLQLSDDPPVVMCSVTNPVQPIVVDDDCKARIDFSMNLTDDCCLDPLGLNLDVSVANPTNNATVGVPFPVDFDVLGPAEIAIKQRVTVSDLTGCPATVEVTSTAQDCGGLASEPCVASVDVVDLSDPVIQCPADVTVACGEPTDPDETGFATAADNCDATPVITFADAIHDTTCLADPVMFTIERAWTAKDECGNFSQCTQTITVLKKVFELDIKPRSCPNPYNPSSSGVMPVSLLGAAGFDVASVDLSSLRLSRADCVGNSVAPKRSTYEDAATPFPGDPCECHTLGPDGLVDLSLKFTTADVVGALQLGGIPPGNAAEVVLSGKLTDGCEFIATDCLTRTAVGK
jgi:cysteine-rich repeat protein